MALPVRHLPVVQNWDCHGCTNCCRDYHVYLTDAERARIGAQDWKQVPELADVPLLVGGGGWLSSRYRLNQRADGACVFLDPRGRCRIHAEYGSAAKPLACRIYPFVLVPAGDHWRVGLRYSCPSVAKNQGKPLAEFETELREYGRLLEVQEGLDGRPVPPPDLQPGQSVAWPDLLRFTAALLAILGNRAEPLERRWRKCLALATLCRQAKFDQVKGARLAEFLELVSSGLDAEVPADLEALPAPSWVGRILFRQALAVYLRKDAGPERGPAARNRRTLFGAAWRFAIGRGPIPRLHAALPETTFEQMETPLGPMSEAMAHALERYYLVKVGSMQFCGPSNFSLRFWEGLEALALTFPIVCAVRRMVASLAPDDAIALALHIVDHNFAYNPHLGARRHRVSLGLLRQRGELEKLIAWYSR
ncbi:MAG: YkgJ family cysteine cluster protein [Gemmataceae bacterium]|nr:YkgJ family cysteine cluster protein [Gemmataceae bacterium]